MEQYPDSPMSGEMPLDPQGPEFIYDAAHSFLYRSAEGTPSLWPLHSSPATFHQFDSTSAHPPLQRVVSPSTDRMETLSCLSSPAEEPSRGVDARSVSSATPPDAGPLASGAGRYIVGDGDNSATMGMEMPPLPGMVALGAAGTPHGVLEAGVDDAVAHTTEDAEGWGPSRFQGVVGPAAGRPLVAELSFEGFERGRGAGEHMELAAWNRSGSENDSGGGGGEGEGVAPGGALWTAYGDDDEDDDSDEDYAEDEDEDVEFEESLGGDGTSYDPMTLVGGLLNRVGLQRLMASRRARESYMRSRQGFPQIEACPVPFLKGDLSLEIRAQTNPEPPQPHGLHLLLPHHPCATLSLDELNQPMHELGGGGGDGADQEMGIQEGEHEEAAGRWHTMFRPASSMRSGRLWLGSSRYAVRGADSDGESDEAGGTQRARRGVCDRPVTWRQRLHRMLLRQPRQRDGSSPEEQRDGSSPEDMCRAAAAPGDPAAPGSGSAAAELGLPDGEDVRQSVGDSAVGRGAGEGSGDGAEGACAPVRRSRSGRGGVEERAGGPAGAGGSRDAPVRRSARLRGRNLDRESADAGAAGAVAVEEAAGGVAAEQQAGHIIPAQPNVACMLHSRECGHDGTGGWNIAQRRHVTSVTYAPSHKVREIEARPAKAYIGKFSARGDLFVAAYQDKRLRVFDTTGDDFVLRKDVEVRRFRWTVTDTAISPDSSFLLYSSICPQAHLVRIGSGGAGDVLHSVSNITEVHEELNFLGDSETRMSIGIWSLAWSPRDSVIAAGTSQPGIILYDLGAERRLVGGACHHDDVNAIAFADAGGNIIISGSDDSRLFIHDRRTLRGDVARPEGQLLGHTEGVTHVDARGDGRYVISNSKDSTIRLWDLRQVTPARTSVPEQDLGSLSHFDYRWHEYPHAGLATSRPIDNSLMVFRGHKVLQTLIRAYWAPPATTAGRCIYSGSADGSVYIFDTVTGHVLHELRHHADVVRDCSWHPHRQQLVSVSWDGSVVEWGPRPGPRPDFQPSLRVDDIW